MQRTFPVRRSLLASHHWARRLFCAWLALAGLAVTSAAQRASAESATAGAATRFVEQKQQELQRAIRSSKNVKGDPKLLAIFDSMLNYDRLTHDALAKHWDEMTPEQRDDITNLLKQLVQNSYRKNLRDPSDYKIEYLGERSAKDGTLVHTRTSNSKKPREKPLSIDYIVEKVEGRWLMHDVVTDGVSLVRNYRRQFTRIIKKKGVDGLREQMRKQLDKQATN